MNETFNSGIKLFNSRIKLFNSRIKHLIRELNTTGCLKFNSRIKYDRLPVPLHSISPLRGSNKHKLRRTCLKPMRIQSCEPMCQIRKISIFFFSIFFLSFFLSSFFFFFNKKYNKAAGYNIIFTCTRKTSIEKCG